MKVHIDLSHPAHVNLFKGIINTNSENMEFLITCLDRGKVVAIAKREIKNNIYIVGKHRGTFWSIIFEANILKFIKLYLLLRKEKIDVGISFGSFIAGAVHKLKGVKSIQLDDDPERKLNVLLGNLTSDEHYFPPIITPKGKTSCFNALKEWSYLSPRYFNADVSILEAYGLQAKQYIFIREVSNGSLNYLGQQNNPIAAIADQLPKEIKVLLSLEDKNSQHEYPNEWIILKEPINDIHSLIYFSKIVLSSGDSMAREGAMLGVPSIYCGFRDMKANDLLIDKGIMAKVPIENVPFFIQKVINGNELSFDQEKIREKLMNDWDDVNDFLIRKLIEINKK